LASLSPGILESLLARCTAVPLPVKTVLYDAEVTPKYAYLITSGIASVVTTLLEGGSAEIGLVGREGLVGAFHLLGPAKVPSRCFMQLPGTGLQLTLKDLRSEFEASEELDSRILESVQEQSLSLGQLAGCQRLHGAEERLARWLLMAQARIDEDVLGFSQEFMGMMLGANRTTVAIIAGTLQQRELIEYKRAQVKILDRGRLEAAACECYAVTKRLYQGLYQNQLNGIFD
jgi:CRP-like cAMP-binding protein